MSTILGVRIDGPDNIAFETWAKGVLRSNKRGQAVYTPNAEMLVRAYRCPSFRDVLNGATITLCDSRGVQLLIPKKISRYTGVDAMDDLLTIAGEQKKKIYLLGSGREKTLNRLIDRLRTQYPQIQIVGAHKGPRITIDEASIHYDAEENNRVIHDIVMSAPDVLFVAFGHEKQERWIDEHRGIFPSVQIFIGVGGAFDLLSGRISRAPKLWRDIGFEWLWRLIMEPCRLKRIITATIVFPLLVMKNKPRDSYEPQENCQKTSV